MVFLVIGFLIWLYSLKQLKKAFLCFLIYKVFLVTNINVLSLPGMPILSLDMCLTLWFFIWIFRKRKSSIMCQYSMPYTKPMLVVACVYFISTIFSIVGVSAAISAYIKDVCNIFLTPWMIWKMVDSNEDFRYVVKGLMLAFFVTCLYGIIEQIIQSNPLIEYETTLVNDATKTIDFRYKDVVRGYRVQSVFEHPIGAGLNWGVFSIFLLFVLCEKKDVWLGIGKIHCVVVVLLCLLCLLLSNCRGPILFFIIACIALVDLKNKRSLYAIMFAVLVGGILLNVMEGSYVNNFLSIFDADYQTKVGGSSSEQRLEQLDAVLELLKQSPIWGLGYKFMNVMSNRTTRALLGLESMWFRIMVQFGLAGVVANVYLGLYSLLRVPRRYRQKKIFWFSLAYWVTASLTSVPGMLLYLYYFVIFYLIKQRRLEYES